MFIPPLVAAVVALVDSRQHAALLAYIAGTLIGADLLNLSSIQGLGAPVASIGGAEFDGIFNGANRRPACEPGEQKTPPSRTAKAS